MPLTMPMTAARASQKATSSMRTCLLQVLLHLTVQNTMLPRQEDSLAQAMQTKTGVPGPHLQVADRDSVAAGGLADTLTDGEDCYAGDVRGS